MAVVEGGEGRQKRVSSVGAAIALSAVELCAELGCPSGSGSRREDIVLGLAFGRVSENVEVAATLEGAVAGRGGVDGDADRWAAIGRGDGGRFAEMVVGGVAL